MKKVGRKGGKKSIERPVFEAIRKPLAPPGHPLGQSKPEERARPSMRKAKYRQRPQEADAEE